MRLNKKWLKKKGSFYKPELKDVPSLFARLLSNNETLLSKLRHQISDTR